MVIVFASDESFVQHFLVALNSLIDSNTSVNLEVYLLNKDVSESSKLLIRNNVASFQVRIYFIQVNMETYKNLMTSEHITIDAYFRLAIPDLLPPDIDRVIYLDCDTVITGSLETLWNMDLQNKAFAAVPDLDNIRNIEMGLGNTPTFNSGVMVINLKKWRQEGTTIKLFRFLEKFPEKIKFHDQDALNEVLLNDILELPVKWNLTTPYIRIQAGKNEASHNLLEIPAIIHFNGNVKPWHYRLRHPYKHYYYKYLSVTPFTNYIPEDKNLNTMLRKYLAVFFIFWGLKKN